MHAALKTLLTCGKHEVKKNHLYVVRLISLLILSHSVRNYVKLFKFWLCVMLLSNVTCLKAQVIALE